MVSLLRATGEIDLGKITLPGVKDCPIRGEKLPLDTAETVADASFIVAVVTHPDLSRDTSRSVFCRARPRRSTDIKRLIDFMLGASPAVPTIDPQRIGFFGFSPGGYTGLVLIGANPDWATASGFCQAYQLCELIRGKKFPAEALAHDPRIKAAVLTDAGPIFFTAGSFAAIKVTIRLWASERGCPRERVDAVDSSLPGKHEYHVVPNSRLAAGGGAFMLCSPELAKKRPEFCADAPGFDRIAFHKEFNAAVLAFFRAHLTQVPRP